VPEVGKLRRRGNSSHRLALGLGEQREPKSSQAKGAREGRLVYYAFDLLYLDGFDLRLAPLIDRKRVLEALLDNTAGAQLTKYVEHIAGDGVLVLEHVCKLGLEGMLTRLTARAGAPTGSRQSAQRGRKRTRIVSRRWPARGAGS
jgi:ATP-dependent DNA ligase